MKLQISATEPHRLGRNCNYATLEAGDLFCMASHSEERILANDPSVAVYMKVNPSCCYKDLCTKDAEHSYALNLRNGNLYDLAKGKTPDPICGANRLVQMLSAELVFSLVYK